jgi:hypothetical protein
MPTKYKICPSIGIARLGNSPDAFYFGPEKFRGLPTEEVDGAEVPVTQFRDPAGRMKRQAARFGVHAFDDASPNDPGRLVEIGKDGVVDIEWTVHLANKKAIWFRFEQLKGEGGYDPATHPRRNAGITDPAQRQQLIIDPGLLTVSQSERRAEFAKGKAQGGYRQTFPPDDLVPFPINTLGEIRTDPSGRLTVLGGLGSSGFSASVAAKADPKDPPTKPTIVNYANNDGWFDDISDGPVTARLVLADGSRVEVDVPAWVLATPPAFAPQVPNVVTLFDTIYDVFVRRCNYRPEIFADGAWVEDYKPDFAREIEPMLRSAEVVQWVIDLPQYAHFPLQNPSLADASERSAKLRQWVMDAIRPPDQKNTARGPGGKPLMPYQPGDNSFGKGKPAKYAGPLYLTVTETQYFLLQQWAKGCFRADGGGNEAQMPGAALDEAILRNCVGGPFCPGIEITWIARDLEIYSAPFRVKHRTPGVAGLSPDDHPGEGVEPGDLGKRMALPWQADFNECTTQGIPPDDTESYWWPAQRPLSILLEDHQHAAWDRGLPQNPDAGNQAGDLAMVSLWKALGFVINQGTAERPNYMEVERDEKAFGPGV